MPSPDALHRRNLARALFAGAGALLAFGLLEHAAVDQASLAPLVVRGGWAALAVAVGWVVRRSGRVAASAALACFTASSAVLFALLLHARSDFPLLGVAFFLGFPIVVALALSGELPAVAAGAAASTAAGAVLLWAHRAGGLVPEWLLGSGAAGAVALYAVSLQRRLGGAEARARRDRETAHAEALRASQARGEAERSELLGQLAAGLAHEINNPLMAVSLNLEYLQTQAPRACGADAVEALGEARACLDRITHVVQRVRAVAPGDAKAARAVDAVQALRAAATELSKPLFVEVRDLLPAGPLEVVAQDAQAHRLFRQVLLGALEALSHDAGAGTRQLTLTAQRDGPAVVVAIEDDARVPRSLGDKGDGALGPRGRDSAVGLLLVRELLRQWGGELSVTPGLERGERVVLKFRSAEAVEPTAPARGADLARGALA